MWNFITIDFETANPKRVSACALGITIVEDAQIVESKGYLIKPIGGHASFQSKIHGIKEEHTFDKLSFIELLPEIEDIFNYPLIGHSLFDKQVLNALSQHYDLNLNFDYTDSVSIAREKLPDLHNHKLKTLVKHFDLGSFKHHDACDDAIACAKIVLKLQNIEESFKPYNKEAQEEKETNDSTTIKVMTNINSDTAEFKGLAIGILADDVVNYKEAYQLLYWLEEHETFSSNNPGLLVKVKEVLEDDLLTDIEALEVKVLLEKFLNPPPN